AERQPAVVADEITGCSAGKITAELRDEKVTHNFDSVRRVELSDGHMIGLTNAPEGGILLARWLVGFSSDRHI
ncbi:hypothetical protein, partial [Escherichia coli]|uniref:hypothetical protein n=1 Tax=Escherichia coli TaxID=562 RepID=UPI001BB471B3